MRCILTGRSRHRGFALAIVVIMTGVSFLMLGGLLMWSMTSSRLAERNTDYLPAISAAEAATEKVFARVSSDFHNAGRQFVHSRLASYATDIPGEGCPEWNDYEFHDPAGVSGRVYVNERRPWSYSQLEGKYSHFKGFNAVYDIVANARLVNTANEVTAAVWQQVQIAELPVASFAYFYNIDLELHPWHDWNVTGQVYCNENCYFKPSATLTFQEGVTAVKQIIHDDHPLDPESRSFGSVVYNAGSKTNATALNLIPTSNPSEIPFIAHKILEPPDAGESPSSLIGRQRYWNKADMIVKVVGHGLTNIQVFNGVSHGRQLVNSSVWTNFLREISTNTPSDFHDLRENRRVIGTELDVQKLMSKAVELRSYLGANYESDGGGFVIYLIDYRTNSNPEEPFPAVRITNGASLWCPLTVATPNPLYTVGDFNTNGQPASLACDAITVLSQNWDDTRSDGELRFRDAQDTTVNAAVITGIVPTGIYEGEQRSSGWVANVFRLLEDWSDGQYPPRWNLYFNGSIAVLFASQQATAPWYSGWNGYYNAPTRYLSYNTGFLTQEGLPPGCPTVSAVIRSRYEVVPPGLEGLEIVQAP